jgi:hypothetical protein
MVSPACHCRSWRAVAVFGALAVLLGAHDVRAQSAVASPVDSNVYLFSRQHLR